MLEYAKKYEIEFVVDEDFLDGRSLEMQIRRAIQNCPKFLIFYSKHYLKRTWTTFELSLLKQKYHDDKESFAVDNSIIFFCIDDLLPNDEFSCSLAIKLSEGFENACNKLIKALKVSILL